MEGLLILIAHFLAGPILFAAIALFTAVFVVTFALLEVTCALLHIPFSLLLDVGARRIRKGLSAAGASKWPRRIGKGLLAVVGLLAVLLLLLNTFLFAPALRWGFGRLQARSGIEIGFESASGSFLRGAIRLKGVTLKRTEGGSSRMDLRAAEAELDMDLGAAFGSPVTVRRLRVAGLEGLYEKVAVSASRRFQVDHLLLENAAIRWRDARPDARLPETEVRLERLECRPFRSDWAALDAFFRSNAKGTLGGAPFALATSGDGAGRRTTWKAEGVDARWLADAAGGPFSWIRSGRVDADVVDTWRVGEKTEIDLHWKLRFRELQAGVPDTTTGLLRTVLEPVAAYANARSQEMPVEFTFTMDEQELRGAASLDAARLWQAAGDAALHELARRSGVPADTIRKYGQKALEGFRAWLEERRKPK